MARQQATLEAGEFVGRMRQLGVGEAEMFAILRREVSRPPESGTRSD